MALAIAGVAGFYTLRLVAARNAAMAQAARTLRIQQFMTRLFEGGDEAAGPADSLRVVTLLERGAKEAGALDREPAAQAELYQTLGDIQEKLGNFDRADTLLRAALSRRRAALGSSHPDVGRNLEALALLRSEQSRHDEAERLAREAKAIALRHAKDDPASLARAGTTLGEILENRGEYPAAIEELTQALRRYESAGADSADLSAVLTELANCHFYTGHYAASDSLNRVTLAMDRKLYGDRHPHVASDLINIGAIRQELGHPAESEAPLREALGIYQDWYGRGHYEVASTLTSLARALIPQGRYAEADSMLRGALAIRLRVYGPASPNVASTLNELGRAAMLEGRLDVAERDFLRTASIYKAVYQDHHYLVGLAITNLGGVYMERKQYALAEQQFREGARRYTEALSADHLYTGIARVKLGRALLRQKRFAEAERESLAGYSIVAKQKQPAISWLQNARRDLVEEYQGLDQPRDAARYRAELADTGRVP